MADTEVEDVLTDLIAITDADDDQLISIAHSADSITAGFNRIYNSEADTLSRADLLVMRGDAQAILDGVTAILEAHTK